MEESLKDDSALVVLMKYQTTDIFDGTEAISWKNKTEKADISTSQKLTKVTLSMKQL